MYPTTPCNIPTESIRFQWGFVRIWMGSVKCGWGWSNVDGVGYFSSGVDNFCFEVMGTEGKEDIVPKGQHAMSEDHALGSLHITVPEYS